MKVSNDSKKALGKFLNRSLNGLEKTVSDATSFAKKELPLVAKEILMFEGVVNNLFGVFVSLMIGIANYKTEYFIITNFAGAEPAWYLSLIVSVPVGIACLVAGLTSLQDGLKARVAPRLFLLEYTKKLLSKDDS